MNCLHILSCYSSGFILLFLWMCTVCTYCYFRYLREINTKVTGFVNIFLFLQINHFSVFYPFHLFPSFCQLLCLFALFPSCGFVFLSDLDILLWPFVPSCILLRFCGFVLLSLLYPPGHFSFRFSIAVTTFYVFVLFLMSYFFYCWFYIFQHFCDDCIFISLTCRFSGLITFSLMLWLILN